jgi:hypothetical protein
MEVEMGQVQYTQDGRPIAYCRLLPPDPHQVLTHGRLVRQWEVTECPLCGKRHWHGAGYADEDASSTLGHRVAHCGDLRVAARGYILVEAS